MSNAIQTNALLLNERWCEIFREYNFLLGVSIDGPEAIHDLYRRNKEGRGTWKQVMRSIALLQKRRVEFNALCVVSTANVEKPKELYKFYKSLGIEFIQFIPTLAEFRTLLAGIASVHAVAGTVRALSVRDVRPLVAGYAARAHSLFRQPRGESRGQQKPGACTMHESCDSYVVVEYNGDVYPCDFFVEREWKLGNINQDSWIDIARRQTRYEFAVPLKGIDHVACAECDYRSICQGGCPHLRRGRHGKFEDLDYYCPSYKMLFEKNVGKLTKEVEKMMRRR